MRAPTILTAALLAQPALAQELSGSFEFRDSSAHRLADTDGDGRQELLLVHTDPAGRATLRRVGFDADNKQLAETGCIVLADPMHCLIAVADLLATPGDEIIVASRRNTACYPWQENGSSEPGKPKVLARRARFTVRTDTPKLSPFIIDLNKDGLLDLMVPSLEGVQPYFQEKVGDDGMPVFRRMKVFTVPIGTTVGTGGGGLDQELTGSIGIPQINTEDLNGDGRPDMTTSQGMQREYHIQRADGTFAPPIKVDLTQFVDSTPKAVMDLGKTAVLSDLQMMRRGDLNGDGCADHVISHRRKIWTFLGDSGGPQFRKARTQAVADDVTQMLLLDLDGNDGDDLLTFRVQLPSLATVVLGLVQSIDIDVRAVGYPSEKDGFARKPKWRRTVTVRVPPLLSLLSRQDELINRFTDLVSKARMSARGKFLGDDDSDLALVALDNTSIELFSGVPAAPELNTKDGGKMLADLLFHDENTLFDLDRIFGLASGFLDKMSDQAVGEHKPAGTIKLRDPEAWFLTHLRVGEFDGKAGEEILAIYRSASDRTLQAFDVIRWK